MSTEKQLRVITSQLDVLEELKDEFESIAGNLNSALSKGRTWIEDSSSEGYFEINLFLANQAQECLRRCYKLINEYQRLEEKINEISALNEETISGFKIKQDDQEKRLQLYFSINEETENRNKVKFDGIRQEIEVKANKSNLQFNEFTKHIQETNNNVCLLKTQIESLKIGQSESKKYVDLIPAISVNITQLQGKVQTNETKVVSMMKTQEIKEKDAQKKLDDIIKEFSAGKYSVASLRCQAETALNGIKEHEQRLKALSASVEKVSMSEIKINGLERAVNEYVQKQASLEQATNTKIETIANELKPLGESISSQKVQIQAVSSKLENEQKRLNTATIAFNKLHANVKELSYKDIYRKAYTASTNVSVTDLAQKQAAMEEKNSKKIGTMAEDIKSMSDSLASQKVEIAAVSSLVKDNHKKVDMISLTVDKLKISNSEMSSKLTIYTMSTNSSITDQAKKIEALQVSNKTQDKKLDEISSKHELTLRKVAKIEPTKETEGFEAFVDLGDTDYDMQREEILTCFTDIKMESRSGSFDADSGIFQVQVPGFYLCSFVIGVNSFVPHQLQFRIIMKDKSDVESVIATCHTRYQDEIVSTFGVKKLDPGFRVYVKPTNYCKRMTLNVVSHFSCILLNKI